MDTTFSLNVDAAVQVKWQALLDRLRGLESAIVAFSGGVDSSLLSVAAYQVLGERMLAVFPLKMGIRETYNSLCG